MQDNVPVSETAQEAVYSESKFLTFQMDHEEYGIPIEHVIEIIGIQKITPLPEMPSYIKGVINLRGKVIPVIDVRLRFGMPEREYDERTCIIVVHIQEIFVGLIVDSVKEVLDIPDARIEPPPRVQKGKDIRFVQGLGKVNHSVKIILNIQKLIFSEEIESLQQAVNEA